MLALAIVTSLIGSSATTFRTSRTSDRWRRGRYLIRSAAHPLGRGQKLKRLAVLRHDIVFRATGHFFLQAVPLDGIELLLGEQREALGIAHLRYRIVGAFGEGDRVGNLRRLDVLQEFQRERREIWIVDRRGDLDPRHAAFAVDRAFQRRDGAHLRIAVGPRGGDRFLAGIVQAPITTLDITDVVADSALAAQLRCEEGRQFIMVRGERRRWSHSEEPPIALVRAYMNAVYGLIRPELAKPSEALASIAERALNVRVQRIVQELQPIALDADEAASLAAPVGSPAILVWRWYYLDNDDLIIIARSTYPQGRMVFRTELIRSGPQAGNA